MNYIVGDIGNTLTKICLVNKDSQILKEYSIETKKLFKKNNIYRFFFPILKKKNKKKKLEKKYSFQALFHVFIIKLINLLKVNIFNVTKLKVFH